MCSSCSCRCENPRLSRTVNDRRGWGGSIAPWGFDAAASELAYELQGDTRGVSQQELGVSSREMERLRDSYRRVTGNNLRER